MALARRCLRGAGSVQGSSTIWGSGSGRQMQRLFVSPDDGALARLHGMCDIRLAAVNPVAP